MFLRQSIAFLLVVSLASHASAAIRIVAASGQSAPGTAGTFSQIYFVTTGPAAPALNNDGKTVFTATMNSGVGGVTAVDDTGAWSEATGSLALAGREGSAAPGGPAGALFRRLDNPVINDNGRQAFHGLLREDVAGVTLASNEAIWSNGGGALGMIAREGNDAPGTPAGVAFNTLLDPTINTAGQAAFQGTLKGSGVTASNDKGIWAQQGGTLGLVARSGESAPGTPAGVNFTSFAAGPPSINELGHVSFRATLTGTGVTAANDGGVWVKRGGAVSLVALEGNQAAGLEAGTTYGILSQPSMNAAGQTAFVATLAGGVNAKNVALYAESGNTPAAAVRKGDAAPMAPAGSVFANFTSPLFNASNDLAFQATISGPSVITSNNDGIWIKQDGVLKPIALEGTSAPGAPAGVLFNSFSELAMNASGQIAFLGTLTGSGVTAANDGGIWATTLGGELRLVAREGGPLANDLTGVVNGLYFAGGSNNEDGQRSGFNDRGDVAFLATFADGSSRIAVSDAVAQSAADFNGDSFVDGGDFLIWQRNLGMAAGALKANGDADGDQDVDAADLAVWKGDFGAAAASSALIAAVPEPSAAAIAATLVMGLMTARRPVKR